VNVVRIFGYELSCEIYKRECVAFSQQLAMAAELFDFIAFTKKFAEREARAIFKQIIQGLESIHQAGAIHGNLTPKNVVFDADFNVKLGGFGFQERISSNVVSPLVQFNRSETGQGKCLGCVAPEVLNGQPPSAKSDIFSSGVILFLMLAGYAPFMKAIAKDWWFDKLMKSKYKLFWMAIERTVSISVEAKGIIEGLLAARKEQRIDIEGIKHSQFWRKNTPPIPEVAQEMKRRKAQVFQDWNRDHLLAGASRSGMHMMINCQTFQGDLPRVSEAIQLKNLVRNPLTVQLKSSESKSDLIQVLCGLCDMYFDASVDQAKYDVRDQLDQLSDEEVPAVVEIFSKGAELGSAQLLKQLQDNDIHLMDKLADIICRELRRTLMGIIEDYSMVEKFSDVEETVDIPSYDSISFKGRFFSYRTKIGFGLLGFACSLFVAGKGKIQIHPKSCSLDMTFNVQKKLVLPHFLRREIGEIAWKQGKMPLKVVVHVELAYDERERINVAIFEHKSNHYFDINEFGAIIKELTSNSRYWLRDFLQRPFTKSERFFHTNILRDLNQVEEEVEDFYHSVYIP